MAARDSAAPFGPRLRAAAARRGAVAGGRWDGPLGGRNLAVVRPVHVGGDGARGIGDLAAAHFGARTAAVAFAHAAAPIWTVARAVSGADSAAARGGATVAIRARREVGAAPVRADRRWPPATPRRPRRQRWCALSGATSPPMRHAWTTRRW